jgi:cyclic dehypoxanthinyl futalosine synthase
MTMARVIHMERIRAKVSAGERLNHEEALHLLQNGDLLTLGEMAAGTRFRLHPEKIVTYVVDRNINYTNVCLSGCRFCAFFRPPGHPDGYVLSKDALAQKIRETRDLGGTQILLQGGMNPDLDLDYYLDLLRFIKERFGIHVHGFSPPEIVHLSKVSSLTVEETLHRLIEAGLDSIPGGGAEILVDEVRSRVSPRKCTAAEWLNVMETAHSLGLRTTATMMFGHLETSAHRIEHMMRIRDLQDRTGGFTAFIPWSFQPDNTAIEVTPVTAVEYLKTLAVSRLVLDNVSNIQASWVTQGAKIAQVSLFFGANDLGSTMIEENVVAAAGVSFRLSEEELARLARDAGFTPAKRNTFYKILEKKCA